jgi:two-component system, cell cycle sensor histidine kinase and response regulator CckA
MTATVFPASNPDTGLSNKEMADSVFPTRSNATSATCHDAGADWAARIGRAERLQVLGQLASGFAHDFNNLLTVIVGCGGILGETLRDSDPAQFALVQEIQKAADRGAQLTAQILALSRRQPTVPRATDLTHVVTNLADVLRRLAGKLIEVTIAGNLGATPVNADPVHLEQVILNLTLHARDGMPRGGKLSIEIATTVVEGGDSSALRALVPGRYVLMIFRDNGRGLDKETITHLFEPHLSCKAPGQATEPGLAATWDLVKRAGGTIEVDSTPGKGTTFRVYWPEG